MELTEQEAFNKMTSFCAASEHCRAEVVEKLQRWGIPYDVVNRVAERLIQEKYIDEERYCRAFIRDKYRFDKWGKMKIAQALQMKKIPPSFYTFYFSEIDQEEYLSILQKLLESKKKSIHAENEYELNQKLVRFALSRGFDMQDIRHCIDISDENEHEE